MNLLHKKELENLTKEQLLDFQYTIKQKILTHIKQINRQGTESLIQFLNDSSFFADPASAYYHNAFHGGLLLHSYNVIELGRKINQSFHLSLSDDSIFLTGLVHDFCKIGNYEIGTRKKQNPQYKNDPSHKYGWYEAKIYNYIGPESDFGHGPTSLYYILKKIDTQLLTVDEELAITHHMGPWESENARRFGNVANKNPLLLLLNTADNWAGLYYETQGAIEKFIF